MKWVLALLILVGQTSVGLASSSQKLVTEGRPPGARWRSELQSILPLGDLAARFIESRDVPYVTTIMKRVLLHPRVELKDIRGLKYDWRNEFQAITLVEDLPFSQVHILNRRTNRNFNNDIIRRFYQRENLSKHNFWLVLRTESTARNLMTLVHELAHIHVQLRLEERLLEFRQKYPDLFARVSQERIRLNEADDFRVDWRGYIDSDDYAYIQEHFARIIEYQMYLYFKQRGVRFARDKSEQRYLIYGQSENEFKKRVSDYLVEDYKIPRQTANRWMNSPIFRDLL